MRVSKNDYDIFCLLAPTYKVCPNHFKIRLMTDGYFTRLESAKSDFRTDVFVKIRDIVYLMMKELTLHIAYRKN